MIDVNELRRATREMNKVITKLNRLQKLYKTDGGHLTDAAKAIIQEGLNNGMTKREIADLLEVNPSAISYHTR